MPDFIPKADADFDTWISNFQAYVAAHTVELGLTPAQALEVLNAKTMWGLSYSNHIAAREAAGNAQATKEEKRADATKTVRQIVAVIQARKETTDAQRRSLAITVPDREPTPLDPTAILRVTPPRLVLDHSNPRVVVIHFGPNPDDERRNAKPEICGGARIWWVLGSVPAGSTEGLDALAWAWLADDTNSPYSHNVGSAGSFTYRAQWFDRLMNLGPLGDPVSCAVTG